MKPKRARAKRYAPTGETLALLRIVALGRRQVEKGATVPAEEVFRRLRKPVSG